MSEVFDKLKKAGVKVDLLTKSPIFLLSALAIILLPVVGDFSNDLFGRIIVLLSVVTAWIFGALFGSKCILLKIKEIDKEEG